MQKRKGRKEIYFRPLYDFLCKYGHCNFDVMYCYFERRTMGVSTEKTNNSFWTLICTLFIFTKLYENIVLAKGEDIKYGTSGDVLNISV